MRERLCHRLDDRLCFRQVVQDGVLIDVSGLPGIFGFVTCYTDPVDRPQDGSHRRAELSLHRVHDGQVTTGGRGTQSLNLQERGQGFADGVVDGRVREVRSLAASSRVLARCWRAVASRRSASSALAVT